VGYYSQRRKRGASKVIYSFSTNNGKTWETNWYNEFIHDDNCTPIP
jgi:hypothetical protein